MPSDLDRAYVINGDDLRIALARRQWTLTGVITAIGDSDYVGRLKMPEEVVRAVLGEISNPLDESRWPITRGELETRLSKALEDVFLSVRTAGMWTNEAEGYATAQLSDPAHTAAQLADAIDAQGSEDGDVVDAEIKDDEPQTVRKRGYYDGKTGMQPFDVIDEFGLDFYEGNVVKYIVRWRKKGGIGDLRKARTYIDALITRAEREERENPPY